MEYKGYKAQIMEAERLTGEYVHVLPPGKPLDVYHSEEFVNYPEPWMKGPGVFVIAVKPNKGLWFNFRMNSEINTAVIPTVKGCNPITGQQTSGIHMERYDNKCPKHGIDFKGDRFCSECGYKWPAQNYITGSPLWLDGFRSDDGTIRQFFFTEDEMRDIATHIIGKENTVPAFGFAFYSPKVQKEEPKREEYKTSYLIYNTFSYPYYNSCSDIKYKSSDSTSINGTKYGTFTNNTFNSSLLAEYNTNYYNQCSDNKSIDNSNVKKFRCKSNDSSYINENIIIKEAPVKEVSIGAGAKISQNIISDPYALDSWKDAPDASMVIYFVFEEKLKELKSGGMIDLVGKKEGFLAGIPVG